jgi:hypothetical protein
VCSGTRKDQGGLGVQDLELKNRELLGKWLFKLLTGDGDMANSHEEEVCCPKCVVSCFLETRGFSFFISH